MGRDSSWISVFATLPACQLLLEMCSWMKTPQRWRTSHVCVIIVSATLTLFGVMTSFCDVTWHHRPGYFVRSLIRYQVLQIRKTWKITFLTKWPWPLTYDLDHRTRSRFHQGQSLYQVSCPHANGLALRVLTNWQTDRHTERYGNMGPILLPRPLTREVINAEIVMDCSVLLVLTWWR